MMVADVVEVALHFEDGLFFAEDGLLPVDGEVVAVLVGLETVAVIITPFLAD